MATDSSAAKVAGLNLIYGIDEVPPIHICLLLGFQQLMTSIGGLIAHSLILSEATCFGPDLVGRAEILGTIMFVNGIGTIVQIVLGCRLPILQGPSFAFVPPILAMGTMDAFKCPSDIDYENGSIKAGSDEHRQLWMSRIVVVQGSIIMSGLFEFLIGTTGVIGILFRYIGPLTIAPTTAMIGLCLVEDIIEHYAAKNWPVAMMTLVLVIIFCLFLNELPVPLPSFSVSVLKPPRFLRFHLVRQKLFGLFPVLLAILASWGICALLTIFEVFPSSPTAGYGYDARTDIRTSQIVAAPWFRVPYPGQWGNPKVLIAMVLGMCAGTLASVVESIGDYSACARMCQVPRPPPHAMNRGIAAEGFGCMVAGVFGSGPGVTSYSDNIGAIGITGVASRRVTIVTGLMLIVVGCITKVSSVFVSIPEPVIGGSFIITFAMVASVGFSNLQFVDLNSTRNLIILGLSMFMGLALPFWVRHNPTAIKTGSEVADQILNVLLSTGMLVGGGIGFLLDNTVPGATRKQRGLEAFDEITSKNATCSDLQQAVLASHCYNLPLIGQWIARKPIFRFIPVCPTFKPRYLAQLNIFSAIKRWRLRTKTSPLSTAATFHRNNNNNNNAMIPTIEITGVNGEIVIHL